MDDIYCYKGINVLKNLYDIHNKDILDELERESTNTKILALELRPEQIVNDISIEHLNELHRFLFGNLYEWAGQYRVVDLYKSERVLLGLSVEYAKHNEIEERLKVFFNRESQLDWNDQDTALKSTFDLLVGIWEIHPYREGNTRTCTTFIKRILLSHGIEFNTRLLKEYPAYVRDSLVMATYDEPQYLMRILKDAFETELNFQYFNEGSIKEEYKVAKEKYYTTKQAEKLIAKKRLMK